KLRVDMQVELRQIQKEVRITTVFVTHDQEEAMTLSDRQAVMREGKIVQMDTPQNIYNYPVNTFVADSIGQSNFFEGEVRNGVFHFRDGEVFPLDFEVLKRTRPVEGKQIILSVRPEKIRIEPVPPAVPHIIGIVKFVTYTGNLTTYLVEAMG